MRKTIVLFTLMVLASSAAIHHHARQRTERKRAEQRATDVDVNERMLLQRSYPDPHFDTKAFRNGVADALRTRNSGNNERSSEWVTEGPGNIGGRFNCTAVDPNNANVIYAGAATGGLFKTTNGGSSWTPLFDEQPYLSIGCVALDPQNANTVWAGTGDANISGLCYTGDGIYKSTDGGSTWTNMGLQDQHVLSCIVIDPTDPNTIYAGSMGDPFTHSAQRGLYKTVDGGQNWQQVLYVSDQAGVIDLVMDPSAPGTLYAASYDRIRSNVERIAYGPGSHIWKTVDGGANWTMLTNGLPDFPVSRIGLAVYPQDPDIVYASIADSTYNVQGVYRSNDGGASWSALNTAGLSNYNGYGWYFGKVYVNPGDPDQVYVLGVDSYTTIDGGDTWSLIAPEWWLYEVHADHHHMTFIDAQTILLCTDGGIYRTDNNGIDWTDIENIPANQAYHAIENPHFAEEYWCGVQDNGTSSGAAANINNWQRIYGGDGFQPAIDPEDAAVAYAETQNGGLVFSSDGGFSFQDATGGIDPGDRINWDMPYLISPTDHTVLYAGTDKVYSMLDAPFGTWEPISPDLTDGADDLPADMHTITTLSVSALAPAVIYAGTADANVWVTSDGGGQWTPITNGLPERYVTAVAASPNDASTVYVTHSGYRDGEYIAHVHRSTDQGATWVDISGDLPQVGVNDILPVQGADQLLFAATDVGVYYTVNGGTNWQRLGTNMPMMPVFDLTFNTATTRVIASTFARSVQTIDVTDLFVVAVNGVEAVNMDAQVFPSPASESVNVQWAGHGAMEYVLFNNNGEQILAGRSSGSAFLLRTAELRAGTYLMRLKAGGEQAVRRFVKQ